MTRIVFFFFLCIDFHPPAWKAPIAGGENRRLGRAEKQMPAGKIESRSEAKRHTAPWEAENNRTRRARGNAITAHRSGNLPKAARRGGVASIGKFV